MSRWGVEAFAISVGFGRAPVTAALFMYGTGPGGTNAKIGSAVSDRLRAFIPRSWYYVTHVKSATCVNYYETVAHEILPLPLPTTRYCLTVLSNRGERRWDDAEDTLETSCLAQFR